jgi:cell division protease FtsH
MPSPSGGNESKKKLGLTFLYAALSILLLLAAQSMFADEGAQRSVSYSQLLEMVRQDKVERVELRSNELVAALKESEGTTRLGGPKVVAAARLPGIDETGLLTELEEHKVSFQGRIDTPPVWHYLLFWGLPILLLAAPWIFGMRMMRRAGSGPLSVGKNKAKVYDVNQDGRVTFADVAGVEEAKAELVEIVDYLKSPQKYQTLGAKVPKGVLLVGPPGTGKTLLAKAVAGEAGVPFFSLPASSFIEMFVGVGAARVRDLFEQAKVRAPCIIFIDELDAIGRSRAGAVAMAHEEREQTLNQLLVEMDGFDAAGGVLLMAASNRPEVLDHALLRPGRFDRQVVVDRPDVRGREAILRVHCKRLPLAPDVDFGTVARMTPGMVGADLANVANEAALAAARRGSKVVNHRDLVSAVDRAQMGLEQRIVMGEDEKRRVAVHESGHTLVALSMAHADPVHRVTIIPRSIGALGATLQLPIDDKRLHTRSELLDRICVMLGGRVAEEQELAEPSTGAQNDLERATEIARQMVTRFGMSERMGPLTFGKSSALRFLDATTEERNFSERTAQAIDEEVRRIIDEQNERARSIMRRRRTALVAISEKLLVKETLERDEIDEVVHEAEEELDVDDVPSTTRFARSPSRAGV